MTQSPDATTPTEGGPVALSVAQGVAEVRLCRPPVNALDEALVAALSTVVDAIGPDREVRAVVVTGDGPCFCAGADIAMLRRVDAEAFSAFVDGIQALFTAIERLPKPVIAAIDGPAMGGGLELALACDLRVLGPAAVLGVPEVRLGLLPGAGGTQRLARALPKGRALDLLVTGRGVAPAEALAWGLADRVVGEGSARAAALGLAGDLAAGAPLAIAALKDCVLSGREVTLDAGLEIERLAARHLGVTADFAEGLDAFLGKRSPRFQGV
jgi:enoyl-CoA hydratase/carnithine racemase